MKGENPKMNELKNVEKLECDREEIEITIQQLGKTAECLERVKDEFPSCLARTKCLDFLGQIEKEIEWNEDIIEEIDSSIEFIKVRN